MSRGSGKNGGKRRSARQLIKGGVHRLATYRKEQTVDEPSVPAESSVPSNNGSSTTDLTQLPSNLEDPTEHQHWFRVGPLMCTILALGLAWILLLAWYVRDMPER